jgi:predicted XRE-type DNA-binding protein
MATARRSIAGILPKILQAIRGFKRNFPAAGFRVKQDLCDLLPKPIVEKTPEKTSTTEAEKLVNELKKWATENEKSQWEIARLLSVDRRRVNDWFAGAKMPTLEFGIRIQRLLKGKRRRK